MNLQLLMIMMKLLRIAHTYIMHYQALFPKGGGQNKVQKNTVFK